MPISSGPLPSGNSVVGSEHNKLREDLLSNHTHSGSGDGATVDHTDLSNVGSRTHATIDTDITNLQSAVSFTKAIFDNYDAGTKTSGTGWTATAPANWNGSEGKEVTFTLSPAMPSVPIITCNQQPGDFDYNSNGNRDIVSDGQVYVKDVSATGFKILVIRNLNANYPVPEPVRLQFIVLAS